MPFKKIYPLAGLTVLFFVAAGMTIDGLRQQKKADRPLAFVQKFKPDVKIVNNEKQINASRAERLYSGDTLQTDPNGFALVQFMDKSIAKVKPQSQLIIQGEVSGKDNTSARINLEAGEIFLNITRRTNSNFEVATNTSVASVKGTQFGARDDNYFWVLEGIIELSSNETGQTVNLTGNMFGQVNEDGSIETGELSEEDIEKLNKDYEELESKLKSKVIKLRFRNENGQLREIELKYFEN